MRLRLIPAAVLPAALLLSVPVSTAAQDSGNRDPESPPPDADIVITVTAPALPDEGPLETELSPAEVPLVPDSLPEIVSLLPGLRFESYAEEPREGSPQYRGFGSAYLPVIVDGNRVNPVDLGRLPWPSVPAGSVESVTLLRGAEAARYGSGAITGVLLVDTTPTAEEGYFGASAGSFGYLSGEAGSTVAVGDTLIKASGELFRQDGRRENTASFGGSSTVSLFRPAFESPEIEASLGYSQTGYGLPGAITTEQFEEDPDTASTPEDSGETNRISVSSALRWYRPLSELSLPLYFEYRSDEADIFGTVTDFETFTGRSEPTFTLFLPSAGDLELYGGLSLEMISLGGTAESSFTGITEQSFSRPSFGVFSGALLPLADDWAVEIGGRYDFAYLSGSGELEEESVLQGLGGEAAVHYRPGATDSTFRAAAVYRLPKVDEIASYQGFTTSFNPDLRPERGYALDLASRLDLSDRVSLRGGIYAIFLRDEIAFVVDQNENIDETRRLGAEIDARYLIGDTLELFGDYGYVDARYASGDNDGNLLAGVPQHSAGATAAWSATDWWTITAAYRFLGRYYDSAANTGNPDYRRDLLDLSTAVSLPAGGIEWTLGLSAENLLDDRDPGVAFPTGIYPAPGRRFRVSLGGRY